MPVPFEALLPYGVMFIVRTPGQEAEGRADGSQMFGVASGGLGYIRTVNNGNKRQRYGLGRWDEVGFTLCEKF